jgi:hypothetical protein
VLDLVISSFIHGQNAKKEAEENKSKQNFPFFFFPHIDEA